MSRAIDIYPVILAHGFDDYVARLELVERSSAQWVQVDFMDGKFVPNISVQPSEIMSIVSPLRIEAHLMVSNPASYFSDLMVASVRRVLIHVESCADMAELTAVTQQASEYFSEVGLVYSPHTPFSLEHFQLPMSTIQVMGVHPGQSGQEMLDTTPGRVTELRGLGWRGTLAIDGGVREETITQLAAAGADRFVMASHLFANNAVEHNLQRFTQLVTEGL
jgi:ribulose-phosphate 3-epimerase